MRRLLLVLCLILLASCRGGGGDAAQLANGATVGELDPGLHLSWLAVDGGVAVTLTAGQADDLYQAAAAINYPPDKYEITEVSAAGGLGNEPETFFAGGETAPGRLEFGYTKRFAGPGEFGDVRLLNFSVAETAEFDIRDFAVDLELTPPLLRDSHKQAIVLPDTGGAQ